MCASRLRNRLALIFPLAAVPGVRRVPRAIVSWCLSTSVLTAFAQAAPEAPTVATDGKTPAATRLSNTYPLSLNALLVPDGKTPAATRLWGSKVLSHFRASLAFQIPPDLRGDPEAEFAFSMRLDGAITNLRLVRSSGVPAWDQAAELAIRRSDPLPRPPVGGPGEISIRWGPRSEWPELVTHAKDVSSIAVYANPPFSLADDAIKPTTKGVIVDAVLASVLKQKAPSKGEFETNAKFNERVQSFAENAFPVPIADGRNFAIIHPISAFPNPSSGLGSTIETAYSPEAEVMSITLSSQDCLALRRTTTQKRQYKAKNAFGQQVTVIEADVTVICIQADEKSSPLIRDIVFSIDLPRADAAKVKSRLAFAVIGRLVPPFMLVTHDHATPTIKWPFELHTVERALLMSITDVWLVDMGTGAVLAKHAIPLSNSKPSVVGGFDRFKGCAGPRFSRREVPNFDLVAELAVSVRADGSIAGSEVRRSTGIAELDARTLAAVSLCAFTPGTKAGNPVDGIAVVKFHFDESRAGRE